MVTSSSPDRDDSDSLSEPVVKNRDMATALRGCGGRGRTCGKARVQRPENGREPHLPTSAHHRPRTYGHPGPPPRNTRPKKHLPAELATHTAERRKRGKKRRRDLGVISGGADELDGATTTPSGLRGTQGAGTRLLEAGREGQRRKIPRSDGASSSFFISHRRSASPLTCGIRISGPRVCFFKART